MAGIATVEAADRFIADTYLPDHNRRFEPELDARTDDILCRRTDRTVARDNTVRYERRVLQRAPVKARVRVSSRGPRCLDETPTRQAA